MSKPLSDYQSISEYLLDNDFTVKSDNSGFARGNVFIPAEIIPKHSLPSFYRLAVKEKWISPEKKKDDDDDRNDLARIYGYMSDLYQLSFWG